MSLSDRLTVVDKKKDGMFEIWNVLVDVTKLHNMPGTDVSRALACFLGSLECGCPLYTLSFALLNSLCDYLGINSFCPSFFVLYFFYFLFFISFCAFWLAQSIRGWRLAQNLFPGALSTIYIKGSIRWFLCGLKWTNSGLAGVIIQRSASTVYLYLGCSSKFSNSFEYWRIFLMFLTRTLIFFKGFSLRLLIHVITMISYFLISLFVGAFLLVFLRFFTNLCLN